MLYWIRRFARAGSILFFFITVFVGIDMRHPFDSAALLMALAKGTFCGIIAWFVIFVMGDILLKGAVEDIDIENMSVADAGLLQRIRRQKLVDRASDVTPATGTKKPSAPASGQAVGKSRQ